MNQLSRSPVPFVLACAGLVLVGAACKDGADGDGSGGAADASSGASPTTSTSGSTGTGSDGNTVTLTLASFEVGPGEEVYKCQNFANPFGGAVAEVTKFESHMTGGSHHLLLFYKDNVVEDGPLTDCSGLEFDATPYGTQLPDDELAFPTGVAAAIPTTTGLRLQSHYLNVTGETITANVQVTFHLAEPGTITDHAGVLFLVQPDITIEPMSTKTISFDCDVPVDMKVMKAASHMHKHGVSFHSTVKGEILYDTSDWEEPPPALFSPPRELSAGDPLHFECTFQNDTPDTLTFGESAATNEMCILTASFYPTPAGLPTISCQPH